MHVKSWEVGGNWQARNLAGDDLGHTEYKKL